MIDAEYVQVESLGNATVNSSRGTMYWLSSPYNVPWHPRVSQDIEPTPRDVFIVSREGNITKALLMAVLTPIKGGPYVGKVVTYAETFCPMYRIAEDELEAHKLADFFKEI